MPNNLIKVGIIGYESNPDFYGYDIKSFNPEIYFGQERINIHRFLMGGFGESTDLKFLYTAHGLDRLYRNRNPNYMKMVSDFVEQFANYDLLVMSRFNPIHPEIVHNELKKPIKILGFIDDPYSSYVRGVPYLWAFDGAFYISPSYDENNNFADKISDWGCRHSIWWPLSNKYAGEEQPNDTFFDDRDLELCYVGGAYGDKITRLKQLKKHFGKRLQVYGRWPVKGYIGIVRGLVGKPFFIHRVRAISGEEKEFLYKRTRIGFNMHLSNVPRETGNLRMYEIPAYGMMQVCDRAGKGAQQQIFSENEEAIYYSDIDDAIEKIEYFLDHDSERVKIAKAGYRRVKRDYWWLDNLKKTLDWAMSLRSDGVAIAG